MYDRTYHLEIFGEFLKLNNFRAKFFAPTAGKIALANDHYLIISDGIAVNKRAGLSSYPTDINTLVEFSEVSGKPTVLLWIIDDKICVGYDSGSVACFDIVGNVLFEKNFAKLPVQVMRVSDINNDVNVDSGSAIRGLLWIMFAKGLLISVNKHLFLKNLFLCFL